MGYRNRYSTLESNIQVLPKNYIGQAVEKISEGYLNLEKQDAEERKETLSKFDKITDFATKEMFSGHKAYFNEGINTLTNKATEIWRETNGKPSFTQMEEIKRMRRDIDMDIDASAENQDLVKKAIAVYGKNPTKYDEASIESIQKFATSTLPDQKKWDFLNNPLLKVKPVVEEKVLIKDKDILSQIKGNTVKGFNTQADLIMKNIDTKKWVEQNVGSGRFKDFEDAKKFIVDMKTASIRASTKEVKPPGIYDIDPNTKKYSYRTDEIELYDGKKYKSTTTVNDITSIKTSNEKYDVRGISVVPVSGKYNFNIKGKTRGIFSKKKNKIISSDNLKNLKPNDYEHKLVISYYDKDAERVITKLVTPDLLSTIKEKLNNTSKGKKQWKYLQGALKQANEEKGSVEVEETEKVVETTRPDGTKKGKGFLGELKRPDGNISTELSFDTEIDGEKLLMPAIVPGLTKNEKDYLLKTPPGDIFTSDKKMWEKIQKKAIDHAMKRKKEGKSPFIEKGEKPESSTKIQNLRKKYDYE